MKALMITALALSSLSVSANQYYSSDYEFVKSTSLTLSTKEVEQFKIDAGAGSLKLIGEDTDKISVTAEIFQSSEGGDYCLDLSQHGKKALLKANVCHNGVNNTLVHLSITAPKNLITQIKDGSGSIDVSHASVKRIDDGSGSINIMDNFTSLDIDDGSGSIEISSVQGELDIDDGSGKILVEDIQGNVWIEDGSGKVVVDNVTGKVSVDDGSGSISVRNAQSFELINDGSGSVNLKNIRDQQN
ncbi:hypothetical protein [Pseudoalteromonas luteoviolacea]|uniref:Adhesin domain-containing protein n=1 Tax=Pseudoalteromonas luteoviolacea S4054 TaxID=1129367 RepID=A0A0F6A7R0_9GAMM|nr:hypothetical protein [Pseudoalteromonas luteoviolacea]AOT07787.1 hypothetical protein S4054249_08005 [Pseudoalteromonas luteoviolacea]AOT12703.1 hypothetical protein S40542_08005 [Pseudoalteromonas luteoviolacea]AOT17616.1 hypothetical protein S4054_08000 [Pseudoalteromonas luteoviolacea]KKE82272.1 hypothetical protein N479_18715 [Pseudoalteromonas luteoviolacea S4054]KZN78924.1 hypothetical protein N481_00345 [Pseudoalteromonas luteoviolacea S4047-1]